MSDETPRIWRKSTRSLPAEEFTWTLDGILVKHGEATHSHPITREAVDACPYCDRADYEWGDEEADA